jgi:hypothetical protein
MSLLPAKTKNTLPAKLPEKLTEPEFEKRISSVTAESAAVLQYLRTVEITNNTAYEAAAEQRATFKALFDKAEADRKELVGPLNDVVKRINAKAKEATVFLETAIQLIGHKMGSFMRAEEERQRAELAKAQELAKAGDVAAATQALARAQGEAPAVKGVTVVEEWDFVIEDESAIPREYLSPNATAIRAFVTAKKQEGIVIPGVRAFSRSNVRQRTK